MKKGHLKDGRAMYVKRTEHYVTLEAFATALADMFYGLCEDFPEKLTKKREEVVLDKALFFHGIYGQHEDGYFEGSFDEGERYNKVYCAAAEWVKSKYPYLITENK